MIEIQHEHRDTNLMLISKSWENNILDLPLQFIHEPDTLPRRHTQYWVLISI